jgi:hypothetical protein
MISTITHAVTHRMNRKLVWHLRLPCTIFSLSLAFVLNFTAGVGTANGQGASDVAVAKADAQALSDRELASFNSKITNVMMRLMYVPAGPCQAYYALVNFSISENSYKTDKVVITGNIDRDKARDLKKMLDTMSINWKDMLGDRPVAGRSVIFPILFRPDKCKEVTIPSDELQTLVKELTRPSNSKTMINDKYIYLPVRETKYRTE